MLGLLHAVTSALRTERPTECEVISRKTTSFKSNSNPNQSDENRENSKRILVNCCCGCCENCKQQRKQIKRSPCSSLNRRESDKMLAHCDNNNTIMTHCDNNNSVMVRCNNNNSSKKFKKEKRRSKKELKSSCSCCGSETNNDKNKSVAKPETPPVDLHPLQSSSKTESSAPTCNAVSLNTSSQEPPAITTTSNYYPPPVLKWPHSSVMENPLAGGGAGTTCCRPPPNRTIVKTDGKIIISESQDRYVINDEAGPCRPVDEQTLTKLVRERQGSGKSKSALPRADKGAKPMRNVKNMQPERQTLACSSSNSPSPSYHRDMPPEYSDPPDYFSVI